ncbi:hypothetical protein PYCCODRAFT_86408 [Trametes coccinea BRFM310]|uniref:DUF6533 domain-containing protein n=1 Tax=Trametes coccinea (strain BRFM310) TaxID=1353009 RepID=A0A1Y2IUX1_TRAC3|nr:hypothetical protein PYCCODRAFT_86408 [Trametes coccinea BRFM310]
MSGVPAGQDVAGLISSAVLEDRVTIGSVALVAFDFATTLDEEIRLIWSRGKAASAWLYLALVQFLQSISWAAFSALRTLALSHMNWVLAFIVFTLACAPFAANMWAISLGVVGFNIPMAGCTASIQVTPYEAKMYASLALSLDHAQPLFITGTALSRSCTIAADLIVIATTWWNATYDGSVRHIRGASKMPLTRVLLYNGATYFLALSTLNILHLTLTLLSVSRTPRTQSLVSLHAPATRRL